MFQLRRFQWRRRRAALALLPATAIMVMSGVAAAQTVPAPTAAPEQGAAAAGGRADSKVQLRVLERHVMAGERIRVRGKVRPGGRRWVTIRVGGRRAATVRTRAGGGFRAAWTAPRAGVFKAKAVVRGNQRARRARSKTRLVNAYRAAHASYYGPGLYGNGTACGGRLTPSTIGVAHKTLPCGTKVRFRYHGRTAVARVIDRGPYAGNREWDLTAALRAKLGFGGVGVVLSTR